MEEIEAFAILASFSGLGSSKIRFLLERFGSAAESLKAPSSLIATLPGFDKLSYHWNDWKTKLEWKQNLELVTRFHAQLVPFTDPRYPKSLLEVPDAPALLYMQGQLLPQDRQSIAIVGTRQASIYGMEMAESIAAELAAHKFTIISGLARGIDTAAHQGACRIGRTIAVIGSGLAQVYPPENRKLADEITHNGALLSEFPMATPPDRQNFPQRNRIVSGMSQAVLLIEAPVKSGAMITMEKAHNYKRRLFALPGRADQENFRGNHWLIKSGKAHLIENAKDILAHFDHLFGIAPLSAKTKTALLNQEEQMLLERMPSIEIGIDELSQHVSLPVHQIHSILYESPIETHG